MTHSSDSTETNYSPETEERLNDHSAWIALLAIASFLLGALIVAAGYYIDSRLDAIDERIDVVQFRESRTSK